MDPYTTLILLTGILTTMRYGGAFAFNALKTQSVGFLQMAGMKMKFVFGGIWWFFGGALVIAYVISIFVVFPLMGIPPGYVFNIQTLAAFTYPIPFLIFLGIWVGVGFGAFGVKAYSYGRGRKR